MRVLLVSQYFFPEVGATQTRMMEFARALTAGGHEVDVLTEFPNHPVGIIPERYRGKWIEFDTTPGFRVVRVWVRTDPVKTFRTRLLFYGSFVAMAIAASFRLHGRYDVVAATSPPLPAAFAGSVIARLKRCAFVMDVRDLWPLAAGALKELSNPRFYRWAERLEQHLYRRADRITVTTRAFKEHIVAQDASRAERLAHVPNGTVLEVFDRARGDAGVRARLGLEGKFVVSYAGLHGVAQGLATALAAAKRLERDARFHFLFIGEGPLKSALKREASDLGLTSVTFLDQVPFEESGFYLNASDALLVPLVPDPVFRMFVPSKLFDAMAACKPALLSVDGEAREILEASGAGVYVPPGDDAALAEAIVALADDPARARQMGERGRSFVERHYQRRDQARRFAAVLEEAVAAHRHAPAGLAPVRPPLDRNH